MRELGRGLEYAEVLIRSHLCPLTMGPPAAVKSIGLVGLRAFASATNWPI